MSLFRKTTIKHHTIADINHISLLSYLQETLSAIPSYLQVHEHSSFDPAYGPDNIQSTSLVQLQHGCHSSEIPPCPYTSEHPCISYAIVSAASNRLQ